MLRGDNICCDDCGQYLLVPEGTDRLEQLGLAKDAGWQIGAKCRGGNIVSQTHLCPTCAPRYNAVEATDG